MLYNIARFGVRTVFRICFRLSIKGKTNVPAKGGFILAVNHKSNLDPPMAAACCPRKLRFMAKEELFKNRLFGWFIKCLGAFPISRGKGDIGAIKGAFAILKGGDVMLIFPQGHRIKEGERGKAQNGVAMIAHKMQVPIVPLCISGEYKAFGKITATFGTPIEFTEYYGQKLDAKKLQELAEGVLDNILSYEVKR